MSSFEPKNYAQGKSKVVSIKLRHYETELVERYLIENSLSWADFLIPLVEMHINLEDVKKVDNKLDQSHHNPEFIQNLVKKMKFTEKFNAHLENIGKKFSHRQPLPKDTISLRVKKPILKKWDRYCEKHFLTRTGLIRAAIHEFFSINQEKPYSPTHEEFRRIVKIIEALISAIGAVEERKIMAIFNRFDSGKIYQGLTQLETQGKIMRKVNEQNQVQFVPTGLIEEPDDEPLITRLFERLI